jgi:signal peptidase II
LSERRRGYLPFSIALVVTVVADQATKIWARTRLRTGRRTVVEGFWDFLYHENTGSAFSLLRGRPYARTVLTVFGLAALAGVLWTLVRRPAARHTRSAVALGLIAGGAVGNLWDRVLRGSVTDFIFWH